MVYRAKQPNEKANEPAKVPQVEFQPIPATLSADFQGLMRAFDMPEAKQLSAESQPF